MATLPLQFSFSTHQATAERRVQEEDPFRILLLADLGGSAAGRATLPLAQRLPLRIDIDNFEAVFKRLAPQLELALDAQALSIQFDSLDDFHPDRLFLRLAPFVALRQLRAELADPAQFERAAARLGARPPAAPQAAASAQAAAAGDIERLLGRKPLGKTLAVDPAPGLNIDAWLRGVVAPHVVPDIAREQAPLLAAVDTSIAAEMRRVLHHPAFQALEANWRGVERLVRGLDLGETLQLWLLDVTQAALAADLQAHAADLSQASLHQLLCGAQTEAPDGQRWSLLVSDLAIGADLAELQLLATLGAMAARTGAPLLAAAQPSLLGCASVSELPEPKNWRPRDAAASAFWSALRQSPVAAWIGLALPRVLARQPYGQDSDPISTFAFEELALRTHESYLWGNPAFSLALLAGQAFMDAGWDMELAAGQDLEDLPSHIYREDGGAQQQPGAEVTVGESAGEAILRQGPMALLSYRQRNAARLLRWQSIAEPVQTLQGAWV